MQETITIHDHFQFEIKLNLPFAEGRDQRAHRVETYFFIPNTLYVTPETLSREDFLGRLKNYIRLRIPWVPLERLDEPEGPLGRYRRLLAELAAGGATIGREQYEDHVKVFCLAAQRALRAQAFKAAASPAERAPDTAREFLRQSALLLERYRALLPAAHGCAFGDSPAPAHGDEFLSIVVCHNAFRIMERLEGAAGDRRCDEAHAEVADFLRTEQAYRATLPGATLPEIWSDNESYVFRWSMLKKYMSSALFLEIRERRDNRFWQQVVYSLAAGAAMIFATGIAFIWQGKYGSLSGPLFMALIISYIFKDRMKDLLRTSMSSWLRRVLADRKLAVYRNITSPVGVCKETFAYVSPDKLPPEIAALRDKVHMVDVSNAFRRESVIRYHKEIIFTKRAGRQAERGFSDGMVDITRMGVHPFLRYMDEPEEALYALEGDACRRIKGSKVYHVNMIRVRTDAEGEHRRRYRIVLDRNGIKRIERVR